MGRQMQVVVIGCGPAGWLAACALQDAGASTVLVGDGLDRPWPARYGVWEDLVANSTAMCLSERWPNVQVSLPGQDELYLRRPYARLDVDATQRALRSQFIDAGGRLCHGRVNDVSRDGERLQVRISEGDALSADFVVEATGAASGSEAAHQTAYGVEAELLQGQLEHMVLMDWTQVYAAEAQDQRPSFLYAMPMSNGHVFVEETALGARPPMAIETLKERLELRMTTLGWRLGVPVEVERCVIPLEAEPQQGQWTTLKFGAAGGMTHPATGYQLDRAVTLAPALAAAAVAAFHDDCRGEQLVRRTAAALWPDDGRLSHELYRFGLDTLCALDAAHTVAFFRAFFALGEERYMGYLDRTHSPSALAGVMWELFWACPWRLRLKLAMLGWSDRRRLFRALRGRPSLPSERR